MILKEKLQKLATETNSPCVSISMNTHRTHPDNETDKILLKNLLKEAEERVVKEFEQRDVASLLHKIKNLDQEVDVNYNLDSLHIFLSNDTKEIIKSSWVTKHEGVQISDKFDISSILKANNRSESYLCMVLSQGGVNLYEAVNDSIIREIKNEDFPFSESNYYNAHSERSSDSKYLDNLVKEFLNNVDKALVKVFNETNLSCVVICTEDNYSKLQQVANKPEIYLGYENIDYNNVAKHHVVKQAWDLVKEKLKFTRTEAIHNMKEAVGQGLVLTDLQEIYQAAIDGNGDILIVHEDFSQPVMMKDERTFDLIADSTAEGAIDDITSNIAWEVLAKNGKVHFTSQDEIGDLGKIVLKTRY